MCRSPCYRGRRPFLDHRTVAGGEPLRLVPVVQGNRCTLGWDEQNIENNSRSDGRKHVFFKCSLHVCFTLVTVLNPADRNDT